MKARSVFASVALSLALVSTAAYATWPALLLSYGASLASHLGIAYALWRVPVFTAPDQTTPPMEVVFIQDPELTPEAVAIAFGKTPAASVGNQVQAGTTFTADFGGLTLTASSATDALTKMMEAPLKPDGKHYVPVAFGYLSSDPTKVGISFTTIKYLRNITTGESTINITRSANIKVAVPGYTGLYNSNVMFSATFTADKEFVCPQGYAYSTTSYEQCTLQDPVQAKSAPTLRDEICSISREGVPNPFDPDCAELQGKGILSQGTANGQPTANVRDPKTGQTTATYTNGDGSKGMSRTTPTAGNGNVQEVVKVGSDGKAKELETKNKEDPAPAPANPYQPGGTCDVAMGPIPAWCGLGVNSGSGCTSNCGDTVNNNGGNTTVNTGSGNGLTEGNVKNGVRDGVGEALKTTGEKSIGEQDGDINAETADATDGIFDKFLAFKAFTIQDPGYSCSYALDLGTAGATTLNFSMFGNHSIAADMNLNKVCPLIEPHEQQIQTLALALWSIAAILMFIRLTV